MLEIAKATDNRIKCILKNSLFALIFLLLLCCGTNKEVSAKTVLSKTEAESYLDNISRYELKKVTNPSFGSVGGEWLALGLSRYGTINQSFTDKYKNNLKKYITDCNGKISTKKYSEYARVVIALTSIGENPVNFAGYNLLEPLSELDNVEASGIVSVIYTLIAIDCGSYDVPLPKDSYQGEKTTRDKLVNLILDSQLEDNGWALMGKNADADITAMAVQALVPYCEKDKQVEKAVDGAVERLSKMQEKDGAFSSGGKVNCESTAQVLTALSEARISIDDSRFVKNQNTIIDGLLQFYNNGGFSHLHGTVISQMATEQAFYSLSAYYRGLTNSNRLFDMSDGTAKRELNPNIDNKKIEKTNKNKNSKKKSVKREKNKTQRIIAKKTNKIASDDDKENNVTKKNKIEKTKKVKAKKENITKQKITKIKETSEEKNKEEEIRETKKTDKNLLYLLLCIPVAAGVGVVLYRRKRKGKAALLVMMVILCLAGCKNTKSQTAGTCTILVECSTIFDNMSKLDKSLKDYIPKNGIILDEREVEIQQGDSVYDVLSRELKKDNILMEASFTAGSAYIEGIDNIYEFSCGELSGWSYCVNDEYTNKSSSEYIVKDKDRIAWHFTCDLGEDLKK